MSSLTSLGTPVIGGIVRDDKGMGVPEARLALFWGGRAATDVAYTNVSGHWTYSGVPRRALGRLRIQVTQPAFAPASFGGLSPKELLTKSAVITLAPAVDITGIVVDGAGHPIPGARVTTAANGFRNANSTPDDISDNTGHFVLHHVGVGASLPVTTFAAGFGPSFQNVVVDPNKPLKIVLSPGKIVRGTITDHAGNPLAGVNVEIAPWGGNYASLNIRTTTNAKGQYELRDMPKDDVQLSVDRQGYTPTNIDIPADQTQGDAKLSQIPSIHGRVIDAVTHKPIGDFTLIAGAEWQGNDTPNFGGMRSEFSNGSYSMTIDGFGGEIAAWYVRVEAKGYKPLISPPIYGSGQQDFSLTRGKDIVGLILKPDGTPCPGVTYAVAFQGSQVWVQQGQVQQNGQQHALTDGRGRFDIPPQIGDFTIVATSPAGFARVDSKQLAKFPNIRLAPWGAIDGTITVKGKPAADERISGYCNDPSNTVYCDFDIQSDSHGHFHIEDVAPGIYSVNRLVAINGQQGAWMNTMTESVTVEPGKTATVALGGVTRSIAGRVVIPAEYAGRNDWSIFGQAMSVADLPVPLMPPAIGKGTLQMRRAWLDAYMQTPAGQKYRAQILSRRQFNVQVANDGSFTADDVRPGKYDLMVSMYVRNQQAFQVIAARSIRFTVLPPRAGDDSPLQLPDIKLALDKPLSVGAAAPQIIANNLDGRPFKLTDCRGKFVLIQFWSAQGFGLDQIGALKSTWLAFGKDPRLLIVSVSLDPTPDITADYVADHDLPWTQLFMGQNIAAYHMITPYMAHGSPIGLISPDGKILATGLRGDAIQEAVAKALAAAGKASPTSRHAP
ncbi:MAG TPA: carboxypeptidase regulatory-like domain-containing protein [Tepidisphaeraceae bacterium]|nr:carboxypeptidase regulatory-like domain-containing protein [Tepidisphaeraceae bacterium]